MGRARLPLEVIEAIIDHLHDDKPSLAACSLVCKALICPARYHLFSDLDLNQDCIQRLLELGPVVFPFVRHLRLRCSTIDNIRFWNESLPLLVGFDSIRSLSLALLSWDTVIPSAQSALITQFSAIVHLELAAVITDTFSQLAHFICDFPRLESLGVRMIKYTPDLPSPTLRLSRSLRALDLLLYFDCRMLEWLLIAEERPALRAVQFRYINLRSIHDCVIGEFLQFMGPSLEAFGWVFYRTLDDNRIFPSIDWSCNTGLRIINFGFERKLLGCSTFITQMLSQIVAVHVEQVTFTIGYSQPYEQPDFIDWAEVDTILANPRFSKLTRVKICRVGWSPIASFSYFGTRLPQCDARGILFFLKKPVWSVCSKA